MSNLPHDDDDGGETEYLYLAVENVLDLFADHFGCSPADAANQLRNGDGLASVFDRPRIYAHYQGADIALQAAVLAHGIAEGQVFVDGNKTIALLAMLTFLDINGFTLSEPEDQELARWILDLSRGLTPEGLADCIRSFLVSGILTPASDTILHLVVHKHTSCGMITGEPHPPASALSQWSGGECGARICRGA